MTLTPLATATDVAAMLGRDLSTAETGFIGTLIGMGSALVRAYTRQQITATQGDVITLAGTWAQRITLPQRPVTNVASVVVNGKAMDAAGYTWDRDGNLFVLSGSFMPDASGSLAGAATQLWGPAGAVYQNFAAGPSWSGPNAKIVVTYDHGFAEIPADVSNEVAGMVALQVAAGAGIDKETIGGYSVSYVRTPSGGLSLTDATKKNLDRYRKRAASVSVATVR